MTRRIRLLAEPRDILRYLPPEVKQRVRSALRALADDPLGMVRGIDVKRLAPANNGPELFRARLGAWRIAYALRDDELLVVNIFHRSQGYGWLDRL